MSARRTSRPTALTLGAVLVTFFFTFANASCQGQRIASFSGVQLAFGTEISKNDVWGNKQTEKVPAEPLASVALIAAAVGLVLALIGAARRLTAVLAVAGALSLLILINRLDQQASLQTSGMVDISAGFGLVAAVVLFFVAAGLSWFGARTPQTLLVRAPDKLPEPT